MLVRALCIVPLLRTLPPSARRFGTLLPKRPSKVPGLRTARPSVRNSATLARRSGRNMAASPGAGRPKRRRSGRKGPSPNRPPTGQSVRALSSDRTNRPSGRTVAPARRTWVSPRGPFRGDRVRRAPRGQLSCENQSGEGGFPPKSISRGSFHAKVNLASAPRPAFPRKSISRGSFHAKINLASVPRPAFPRKSIWRGRVPAKINLARLYSRKSQSGEGFSRKSQSGEPRQTRKPRNYPRETHFVGNRPSRNAFCRESSLA